MADQIDDEIDEQEIERELERRLQEQDDGEYKLYEVSDCQSVQSMMTTNTNMDYIPPEANLDDYIDSLLKNKNRNRLKEMAEEEQKILDDVKQREEEDMKKILTEEWQQELQDLKKLNEIDMSELIQPTAGNTDDSPNDKSFKLGGEDGL